LDEGITIRLATSRRKIAIIIRREENAALHSASLSKLREKTPLKAKTPSPKAKIAEKVRANAGPGKPRLR